MNSDHDALCTTQCIFGMEIAILYHLGSSAIRLGPRVYLGVLVGVCVYWWARVYLGRGVLVGAGAGYRGGYQQVRRVAVHPRFRLPTHTCRRPRELSAGCG